METQSNQIIPCRVLYDVLFQFQCGSLWVFFHQLINVVAWQKLTFLQYQ